MGFFLFQIVEDLRLFIDLTVQGLKICLGLSQPKLVLACFNSCLVVKRLWHDVFYLKLGQYHIR